MNKLVSHSTAVNWPPLAVHRKCRYLSHTENTVRMAFTPRRYPQSRPLSMEMGSEMVNAAVAAIKVQRSSGAVSSKEVLQH